MIQELLGSDNLPNATIKINENFAEIENYTGEVLPINGNIEIYDIVLVIIRTHKGR